MSEPDLAPPLAATAHPAEEPPAIARRPQSLALAFALLFAHLVLCAFGKTVSVGVPVGVVLIVAASLAPNAPRTPSPDACKYCRAKSICPEAQAEATALAQVKTDIIPTLTNEQVADFLEKATIVEAFIEHLRSEAKQRLKDGAEIAGYKLTAGRTSRSIESLQEAHSRLSGIIGEDQFLSACKVSVPTLEKAYASAKGLKGKSAKEEFEKEVADLLINKQGEPVMTRTK